MKRLNEEEMMELHSLALKVSSGVEIAEAEALRFEKLAPRLLEQVEEDAHDTACPAGD